MKRTFLYLVVICLTFPLIKIQAQNMSHEEEVVRNAYAKLSFLCSLPPLTQAAEEQIEGRQIDPQALDAAIAKAVPVFELSNFKVGPISEIANDPWGNFVTPIPVDGEMLMGHETGNSDDYNGYKTHYQMAVVYWQKRHEDPPNPDADNLILAQPVSEILKLGAPQWSEHDNNLAVNYTRYAAFTVNATFQGQSTGPHKAIFFFGTDAKGKPFVAANDLVSGENPLWAFLNHPADISGLLLGKVRETPVVAKWLRENVMDAASCSANSQHEVCCSHGRCGISPVEFNRELSMPIPIPKTN